MSTSIRSFADAQRVIRHVKSIVTQDYPERKNEARRLASLLDDTLAVVDHLQAELTGKADAIDLPEGRLLYAAEMCAQKLAKALEYHSDSTESLIRHSAGQAERAKKVYCRVIGLRATA